MNVHIGGINIENLRVSFLFHLLLTNGKYIKCISILLGVVSSLPLSISCGVVRNILWLPTLILRLNIVLLLTLPQNFFSYVGSYKISLSLSPLLLLFVVTIWMPNWSQWHLIWHHLLQGSFQLHFVSSYVKFDDIFTKSHSWSHFHDFFFFFFGLKCTLRATILLYLLFGK